MIGHLNYLMIVKNRLSYYNNNNKFLLQRNFIWLEMYKIKFIIVRDSFSIFKKVIYLTIEDVH